MRRTTLPAPYWIFVATGLALSGWLSILPIRANAQSPGNNAVYNSSGTCTSSSCGFSAAFVDASVLTASAPNICGILHSILNGVSYPAGGAVIDARGLNSSITSMTCTASPWAGITSPPPSTILLPAGTILIPKSWILPGAPGSRPFLDARSQDIRSSDANLGRPFHSDKRRAEFLHPRLFPFGISFAGRPLSS